MTQQTPPTLERTPGIDDAIGHYRLLGVAADASLGRVYIAEQHGIAGVSTTVAVARMRAELVQSPDFRALFFDAASIATQFEHTNLFTIHEMGEVDGDYFASMEYLPGENLASIITKCNSNVHMPPDISASVVKQAANAVQYLHERRAAAALPVGLGPAQINASNVFVTYHGTIKLLNIGLESMPVPGRSPVSGAHRGDGSSPAGAYAAPEQLEGSADRRTDVFCLGVMLWMCLTGRRPPLRRESGEVEIEGATSSQHEQALSSARQDVPQALLGIAMKALSPDPLDRFQSARAMSEELDRFLIRGEGRPTPKQLRRWLEELFDVERAPLQLQGARDREAEGAHSLIGIRHPGSGAWNLAYPGASIRPRELWATSHAVFSRRSRVPIAATPRSFEPGPRAAPEERLTVSSILVHREPSSSTDEQPFTTADSPRAPMPHAREPRSWVLGAALAICAVIGLCTALILASSDDSSPFRAAAPRSELADHGGRLEVLSTPDGAAVFVDGEPTGLRTPVTLKGLARDRKLKLRVEKAGFAGQEREIELAQGSVETLAFELVASLGLVQFSGVPADARIYVDEALVDLDGDRRIDLAVGRHLVRVETLNSLFFSGMVDIVAGKQTIRLDAAEATP
jgi:serine/threonine protein kinase